ncbi:uncharacterized protein LOC141915014 [Tubulanus polymorphus]|uniref:uncharacterized protein LOC141915014 n=1 Tax=Tubulanus polymorphus TaxID=672921 RepID=UPI003DA53F4C
MTMVSNSLILKDTENATFLDSIVDIGELSSSISVLALFQCKGCRYSSVSLNLLTEHLNTKDSCQKVIDNFIDSTSEHPDDIEQDNLFNGIETNIDVKNTINTIVAEAETAQPVRKKRGRPRKIVGISESSTVADDTAEPIDEVLPADCVKFMCTFCQTEFIQYGQFLAHQAVHIEEKLQCKRRNNVNHSRPTRKIKREDDTKPIACPICPMEFLTGYKILQQHFTCHILDEKHFRCPWCEMEYRTWCRMFLHLAEHDENDRKRIDGIIARHSKHSDVFSPKKPIMDEDDISDNEELDNKEEDMYTPSQKTALSKSNSNAPSVRCRRRGRPPKHHSTEIKLAKKPSDFRVMPFPGLDGVFMIGDAYDDVNFQGCNVYDASIVNEQADGNIDVKEQLVGIGVNVESVSKTTDLTTPAPAQTLEDLIEAIETEVKRQQEEQDDEADANIIVNGTSNDETQLPQGDLDKMPVLETFWIHENSSSVQGEGTKIEIADEKERPGGIMSFCPHCVLMRGCKNEIEIHIQSHCLEEAKFVCTLCCDSTLRYDTWDGLRDHYIQHHADIAVWPSLPHITDKSSRNEWDDIDRSTNQPFKKPRLRKVANVKPYRCSRCKTIYLHSLEELQLHKKCHLDGDSEGFKCITCDEQFTAWFRVINHIVEDHRAGKRFPWQKPVNTQCPICGIVKKTTRHMHDHIRTVHKKKSQFICSICGAKFQLYQSWKRHEERHQAPGTWTCEVCGYVAKHSFALKSHRMIKHENKGFPCPYCKYRAPQKNNLQKHVFMVHKFDGKMAMCDICGQQFKNPSSVVNHRRRKHSNNPILRCEICGFETTDRLYLKCHVQKRHDPKKFRCSFCPYGTMQEQALKTHLRTHTEHRPYVCTYESCYFRARDQKTLTSHIRNSHTSDETTRRYKCETCGKSFKTATILKHHLPVHTGEMPHQCFYCPFRAKHRSTVHRHMVKEHKHHQENAIAALPQAIVNLDETNKLIHPQTLINHITTTEDGALIVDESTVEVVNQVAQGLNSEEETTTILVMPVGMDQVQSEVIVDSQNSAQHEAAVQILQQLMQMADTGQQASIDMIEVMQSNQNDMTVDETVQISDA